MDTIQNQTQKSSIEISIEDTEIENLDKKRKEFRPQKKNKQNNKQQNPTKTTTPPKKTPKKTTTTKNQTKH